MSGRVWKGHRVICFFDQCPSKEPHPYTSPHTHSPCMSMHMLRTCIPHTHICSLRPRQHTRLNIHVAFRPSHSFQTPNLSPSLSHTHTQTHNTLSHHFSPSHTHAPCTHISYHCFVHTYIFHMTTPRCKLLSHVCMCMYSCLSSHTRTNIRSLLSFPTEAPTAPSGGHMHNNHATKLQPRAWGRRL